MDPIASPVNQFRLKHWPKGSPAVWVKRDDLLHPIVSGNKWRKLKYADIKSYSHIISIGGGYSNHLHALGYLCHQQGQNFTALVRGNYTDNPTPMLTDLKDWGTDIVYISKRHYQQRDSSEFSKWLVSNYPDALFIPEGGSQNAALQGVGEVMEELEVQLGHPPDLIISPVASGATLAGLINSANSEQSVKGIAVLSGIGYLEKQVDRFLTSNTGCQWNIEHEFTHGGYAKSNRQLDEFCSSVIQTTDVPLEPVYSGKLVFALDQMIMNGSLDQFSEIVWLHTGGLQANR